VVQIVQATKKGVVVTMEYTLLNVLIVDDEAIVRHGLKNVIDWTALGFNICGDAASGFEAIEKINLYHPDLVLLDIRMPEMDGIELIEHVRKTGFQGDFIILSGYSDFKFAQTALHYGVSYYLTKPIEEEILANAVRSIKERVLKSKEKEKCLSQYLVKAKSTVLRDLLLGAEPTEPINYLELGLCSPIYQVVIYEGYTPFYTFYNFADLLKVTNQGNNSFDHIMIDNKEIILLKGNNALTRFNNCLKHFENGTQKGSPLDSIFLTYGRMVSNINEIKNSYDDCMRSMERRFFCNENQHVLSHEALPHISSCRSITKEKNASEYSKSLISYIETNNKYLIQQVLNELSELMYNSNDDIISLKHFLIDIYLQTKDTLMHKYSHLSIPFAHNSVIIELIESKYYLFEIMQYFTEHFEMMIHAIGSTSNKYIFDDILFYIDHNYAAPLKLETIASLFGYNSSYLGKLFTQKINQNFNSYLDEVRINHSIELLNNGDLKVYEIAAQVGYSSVNYFHHKFRKLKGVSPVEYRKII